MNHTSTQDHSTEAATPMNEQSISAEHQQMAARADREFSIETWYASPAAQRGGLETGARGWRFAPPAVVNSSALQRR